MITQPPNQSRSNTHSIVRAIIVFLVMLIMLALLVRYMMPNLMDNDIGNTTDTSIGIPLVLLAAAIAFSDYRAAARRNK